MREKFLNEMEKVTDIWVNLQLFEAFVEHLNPRIQLVLGQNAPSFHLW
jgi:hypothetical protein